MARLPMQRQQRTQLIDLMRKMTHAEQKKVGRACGVAAHGLRVTALK